MRRKLYVAAAITALVLLASAVGCTGFFVNPTLTSLTIGPNPLSLTQGVNQQMTATATYDDGSTKSLTSGVVWSTSDNTIAPITTAGVVTGGDAGTATITGQSGTVTGTSTVNVTLGNVTHLQITPTAASIQSTGNQTFNALATISGQTTPTDVSSTATWTATPANIVSINNTDQTGAVVTPVSGAITQNTVVTVTATYNSNGNNFTASAQLTITFVQ
jgi:hypothetical protein